MAQKTGWIFLVLGAALLAGLFALFKPQPPATGAPAPAPAAEDPSAAVGVPEAQTQSRTFQLVIKDGRLASGPAAIQVGQGEEVILVVLADRADELHLHGYDLALELRAGIPAELRFVASRSGRFDYELHHSRAELGALEVQPK